MKKLSFLVALLAIGISVFADDLIITKDSKSIKAKILEVSKSEIKYKDATNLEGPTFVLGADEIVSIIYENGTAQNFNQSQSANESSAATRVATATSTATQRTTPQSSSPIIRGQIYQKGNEYFINDTKIASNYVELDSWISKNEPSIYSNYKNHTKSMQNMAKWGSGLVVCGAILGGVAMGVSFGAAFDKGYLKNVAAYQSGCAFSAITSIVVATGIPLWIVGSVRLKNNTLINYHNDHVSSYSMATPIRFELQSSSNGLGLAMKF